MLRFSVIVAALGVAACTSARPAAARGATAIAGLPDSANSPHASGAAAASASAPPSPTATPAATSAAPADPLVGLPPGVRGRRLSAEAIAAAQRQGTPVDTILVQPTRLELRVGEAYPIQGFGLVARDTAGRVVRDFSPVFVLPGGSVVEAGGLTLRARAPGTAVLYVEALPRDPDRDPAPRRPSTRVEVVVRP